MGLHKGDRVKIWHSPTWALVKRLCERRLSLHTPLIHWQELSPSLLPWPLSSSNLPPPPIANPRLLQSLLVSTGLQGLALQDQLDLFGIQCLIHEQSICQVFVLFGMSLQQDFGTLIRVLVTAREKMVRKKLLQELVESLNCFLFSCPKKINDNKKNITQTFSNTLTSCSTAACVSGLWAVMSV